MSSYVITYFIPDHLVVTLLFCNGTKILMRPSMAGNLMSLGDHTRYDRGPLCALVVNCTFVNVDTSDKERRFGIVGCELVEHTAGVDIWTVIVSNGNSVRFDAIINAFATIWLVAKLRTRSVAGATSSRNFVGITGRTILEAAVWCCAVVR